LRSVNPSLLSTIVTYARLTAYDIIKAIIKATIKDVKKSSHDQRAPFIYLEAKKGAGDPGLDSA
jgi:vacuolar-type H+-ATPase subunit I/STV1